MKAKAIILFLPFALFFAETMTFPSQINKKCEKMTCMKMMGKMSCSHKKDDCKKSDGKCDNSSNCSICPVCSIFVFQSQFDFHTKKIFFKKDFPLLNIGNISSYSSAIWKPPNDFSLPS